MQFFYLILQGLSSFFAAFGVELLFLIGLIVFAVLIAGVLAPLGALGWWAGWTGRKSDTALPIEAASLAVAAANTVAASGGRGRPEPISHYIVYLSGIGDVAADYLDPAELNFVNALGAAMPWAEIIDNLFPFSMTEVGLTDDERRGKFWRRMLAVRSTNSRGAFFGDITINGRNMLQVAVSVDRRYGPVFNYGIANKIFQALIEQGYVPGSGVPVTLIGYSGGGQVVLASSQYLKPAIDAPLQVISLGGVMSSSLGIDAADEIVHIESKLDPVQGVADYLFWGRWSIARSSRWNRALAAGKLRRVDAGPVAHNGPKGYVSSEAWLPDGRSHLEATTALSVSLITAFRARYANPAAQAPAPAQQRAMTS